MIDRCILQWCMIHWCLVQWYTSVSYNECMHIKWYAGDRWMIHHRNLRESQTFANEIQSQSLFPWEPLLPSNDPSSVYDTIVWYCMSAVSYRYSDGVWLTYRPLRRACPWGSSVSREASKRSDLNAYHTPNIPVSSTKHSCTIHQTSLYHTPNTTVSYTKIPVWHTKQLCFIIHNTPLYHTSNIPVSYTKHHCIIHQTPLYHTPNTSVHPVSMGHTPTSLYHALDIITLHQIMP